MEVAEDQKRLVQYILEKKPYLMELEDRVKDLDYGELELKLYIRAGVVEKIDYFSKKIWLRQKNVAATGFV